MLRRAGKTPHIDKLATQGMRFTRCFQAAPMCSPTRHNIYTGLYPVKSGAWPNHADLSAREKLCITCNRWAIAWRRRETHINPRTVFPFENMGGKNPDMKYIDRLFAETVNGGKDGKPFCLFACSMNRTRRGTKAMPRLIRRLR